MKNRTKAEQEFRHELARALYERRETSRQVRKAVASWASTVCEAIDGMAVAAVDIIDREPFLAGLVRPSAPMPQGFPRRSPPVTVRAPYE